MMQGLNVVVTEKYIEKCCLTKFQMNFYTFHEAIPSNTLLIEII